MDSPIKSGVIKINSYGKLEYNIKKLNLSAAQKRPFKIVRCAYVVLGILCQIGLIYLARPSYNNCEKVKCAPAVLVFILFPHVCIILGVFMDVDAHCYSFQFVRCRYSKRKMKEIWLNSIYIFLHMIFLCPVLYSVIFNGHTNHYIIITALFGILSLCMSFALLYYKIKYCKCKTCLKIKDVKIRFLEETLEVAETDKITKEFLIHRFRLQLLPDERLALKLENESVHTSDHKDAACSQLHEGTYVLYKRMPQLEVKLCYMELLHYTSVTTDINVKLLKRWFGIRSKGFLAILTTSGELLHTLQNASHRVQLKEGTYDIRVMNFEPQGETHQLCETAREEEQPDKPECTILTVD